MLGPADYLCCVATLHDLPAVHDDEVGADLHHDANVMGYKQYRRVHPRTYIGNQIEDLGLNRRVQCRCRLVENKKIWLVYYAPSL